MSPIHIDARKAALQRPASLSEDELHDVLDALIDDDPGWLLAHAAQVLARDPTAHTGKALLWALDALGPAARPAAVAMAGVPGLEREAYVRWLHELLPQAVSVVVDEA